MFLQLFSCILLYSISEVTSSLTHKDVAHLGTDRSNVDLELAKALFEEFKVKFEKNYEVKEHPQRFKIFIDNVIDFNRRIKERDTTGQISQFADLTWKEFLDRFVVMDVSNDTISEVELDPNFEAPEELDWRSKNVVSPVKDQGTNCGTCWAFSAIATLESQYAKKYKRLVSLSEKQLLDCFLKTCKVGSMPDKAWTYLMQAGGSMSYDDYPYVPQVASCQFKPQKVVARVQNYKGLSALNEEQLKDLVASYGPVSIVIQVFPEMHQPINGIMEPSACTTELHAVTIVGYGTENGKPYWLIKNSWSANWGEKGYFRMIRGRNACGIANQIGTVTVV